MSEYLSISDAAKEVRVESHVLRYWEDELKLTIHRNELGHRVFTPEDIEQLKKIKDMKERGLQLKAIKMILKDGRLDVVGDGKETEETGMQEGENGQEKEEKRIMAIDVVGAGGMTPEEAREEKLKRLQWLMSQMILETLRQNNAELCKELKESVIKELDYQFRSREEREEERDRLLAERDERYYAKMDELLRRKSRGKLFGKSKRKDTP